MTTYQGFAEACELLNEHRQLVEDLKESYARIAKRDNTQFTWWKAWQWPRRFSYFWNNHREVIRIQEKYKQVEKIEQELGLVT